MYSFANHLISLSFSFSTRNAGGFCLSRSQFRGLVGAEAGGAVRLHSGGRIILGKEGAPCGASSGWALRLARVGILGRLHTGARWLFGWSPQAWLRGTGAAGAVCTICPLGSGMQVSGGGAGNC